MKAILLALMLLIASTVNAVAVVPGMIDLSKSNDECNAFGASMIGGWGAALNDGNYGGLDESQFCIVWEMGCEMGNENSWIEFDVADTANEIVITYLDGMSNADSFDVLIDQAYATTIYDNNNGEEEWMTESIAVDLASGLHTIEFVATEAAWNGCNDWGQIAIDRIEVKENVIPEFSALAAGLAFAGAGLGYMLLRRKGG